MNVFAGARRFLSRIRSWNGPDFTGIHYTKPNPRGGKPFWNGIPVKSVDQAIQQLAWISRQPTTRDIYVALGTQRTTETKTNKRTGRTFQTALRGKDNTGSFKTLFIDLDVKDGAYATTEEAAQALAEFVEAAGLPRANMAVASGTGGLHVYWVLDRDIPADEWHGLGLALANAGLEHGLKFDSFCSYDYARILRIPDTFNRKGDEPKPVRLVLDREGDISVEEIRAALEPYMALRPASEPQLHPDDELFMGLGRGARLRNIDEVGEQCAWVWDSLENGGRDNNNQLRMLAYALATFCENTDDVAWRMVKDRVTLGKDDPHEFENTLARIKRNHETNPNLGFPLCSSIAAAGAMQCRDCPLLGHIKSPLSQIEPDQDPPPSGGDFRPVPEGYRLDENGMYYEVETDENGMETTHLIFPKPILQPWLVNLDGEWHLQFITTHKGNEPMSVSIKVSDTSSKDTLGKALRGKALMSIKTTDRTFDFMTSFIALLQSAKKGVIDTKPFGWQKGLDGGFAFAGRNYTAEGEQPAPSMGVGYEMYSVQGSPDPWMRAAKAITSQGRPALDAILASSFAAPLVHLCGGDIEGFVIGAVSSHSGVGKTTTLNIAQAVWAHPVSAKLGLTDTINSVFGKAGNLRHLPLLFDEIKGERETKSFIQLLFQLTGGKEKGRMTRSATVHEAKTWSTLLTYGSNSSLSDALLSQTGDTVAGNMRLFEFTVPPIAPHQKNSQLKTLTGMLTENFGHAGMAYAQFIGPRQRELRDRIGALREEWEKLVEADDSERFWVAACACLLLGAELANECGLTAFDVGGLRQFLCAEHKRMQVESLEAQNDLNNIENLVALLGEYLASQAMEYTIVTNRIHDERGPPRRGSIKLIGEGTSRIGRIKALHVHIGIDNRIIRIADSSIGVWAHNRGLNKASLMGALATHLGAKATKQRLGAGTDLVDLAPRAVLEFRAAGTPLDIYLDEVLAAQEEVV